MGRKWNKPNWRAGCLERGTSGSEGGGWKSAPPTGEGNSLTAYPTRGQFRPHFDEWIVESIHSLLSSGHPLVGFILMSCAIDYLASFWYGDDTKGHVGEAYKGFVTKYFPSSYDANALYESLRNGLVHLFTIKGQTYRLIHAHPELHMMADKSSGQLILNAENFQADLVAAKDCYFDEVETRSDLLDKVIQRYERDGFLELQDTRSS